MDAPSHETWPDAAAREAIAQLPPVREDEPASLRRDILDELADHLTCAFRRELLKTNGDAARAEASVRRRFGDPARVARRLWFDAMRGKLMAQKALLGTCAALVVACALFGALLWRAVGEMRESNAALLRQSQEANAALVEQARLANAAALEQMRKLGSAAATSDPEWNPVKVRLSVGSKDGPPAAGFEVTLDPATKDQSSYTENSGPDGTIDFGLMRPGKYELIARPPWRTESHRRTVYVRPGRSLDVAIGCPQEPPKTVPAQINVQWPAEDARAKPDGRTWCYALIGLDSASRVCGEDTWRIADQDLFLIAVHPDGRIIDVPSVVTVGLGYRLRPFAAGAATKGRPEPGRVWAGGEYHVEELGLVEWDGASSTVRNFRDIHKPAIHFGRAGSPGIAGGMLGNVLEGNLPAPTWTAPERGTAQWAFPIPKGLFAWAALPRRSSPPFPGSFSAERLLELFAPAPAPAPAEAPKPEA